MQHFEQAAITEVSSRTHAFKEIENAILSGELAFGDPLTELKLSEQLGVSRTPIREALRQLELEGLVRSVPNKGCVVVGISLKDIEDIYTIRMRIEGLAARWSADNISESELAGLRNNIELQEFYLGKNELEQVFVLDSSFHEIINNTCHSMPLRSTLSHFHHYIQRARKISFEQRSSASHAVEEHRAMFDAIFSRNSELAESLTFEHINKAKERFRVNYNNIRK